MFANAPVPPSPLEGEGARRADEGSANERRARKDWRTEKTPVLRAFARRMRHEPTEAEHRLWTLLRNRRFAQYKFRRQLPVGDYIVDFVCLSENLMIEADGSQHAQNPRDPIRDTYLQAQGFRLLRLWNNDIIGRPAQTADLIWATLHGEVLQ
ncbi:endonuclease domain-containing protein [Devosia sediminis]|uniref:endonuclease domain-containing protein n=1 Tax=Devosia sediminis TaxID=2798801 RepID=UPI002E2CE6B8|nr:DUF559 domain-containing protein [Devosia sediminis]